VRLLIISLRLEIAILIYRDYETRLGIPNEVGHAL